MPHQQRTINNLPSTRQFNGFTFIIIVALDKSLAVVKAWQPGKPVANEPKQAEAGYTARSQFQWRIHWQDTPAVANFNA